MAKRFTDTDKWKRPWFCTLPNDAKLAWYYLLDNCDHTGIWHANFELMSFQLKFEVTPELFESWFGSKLQRIEDDKYFMRSFVDFQYGELSSTNNAHKAVIEVVQKLAPQEPLKSPSRGAQDKEKDKDQDKDQDKVQEKESSEKAKNELLLEAIYREYPKRPGTGKGPGIKSLSRQLKTDQDFADCLAAAQSYRTYVTDKKTEPQFIRTFEVWCGSLEKPRWREWIPSNEETQAEYYRRNGIVER